MNALAPTTWTGTTIEPTPHRWTLDEVLEMRRAGVLHEDVRIELLDGEIIDMPPEGPVHAWFKVRLSNTLFKAVLGQGLWVVVETRLAFADRDAPVPDIYVLPEGSPLVDMPGAAILLLVEVADTTLAHDLGRKAATYAANGVDEYWVVDVRARRTIVHLRPEGDGYLDRRTVGFDEQLQAGRVPGLQLTIADLPGFHELSFD